MGEAAHPGPTDDRMRSAAKMIITEKSLKDCIGSSFSAAYKNVGLRDKILKRIPQKPELQMLYFYFRARSSKAELGATIGDNSLAPAPEAPGTASSSADALAIVPANNYTTSKRKERTKTTAFPRPPPYVRSLVHAALTGYKSWAFLLKDW